MTYACKTTAPTETELQRGLIDAGLAVSIYDLKQNPYA